MGKTQTAVASLVLAIPAGFLAYLTLMAGLNNTEKMPTLLVGLVWTTFVLSAFMAAMPFIALALVKSSTPVDAKSEETSSVATTGAVAPVDVDADDPGLSETTDLGDLSEVDEIEESAIDDELLANDSSADVDSFGDLDDDLQIDDDAFDLDDVDEDAPKKKKKK